jgi:DNA-3-methyladenine glycosylase
MALLSHIPYSPIEGPRMTVPTNDIDQIARKRIAAEFFDRPVQVVARAILGYHIFFKGLGGMITEAEAYDRSDPASHSFRGLNEKNQAMFGSPGTIYIYLYRGMWPHLNLVCAPGSAVLIRALLPDPGCAAEILKNRRKECKGRIGPTETYCSGPGKLGIGLGLELLAEPFPSIDGPDYMLCAGTQTLPIVCGTRINVPKNPSPKWRWAIQDCLSISKPFVDGSRDGSTQP